MNKFLYCNACGWDCRAEDYKDDGCPKCGNENLSFCVFTDEEWFLYEPHVRQYGVRHMAQLIRKMADMGIPMSVYVPNKVALSLYKESQKRKKRDESS